MPRRLPFRSSSVKVKGSGLFSRSRRDAPTRPSTSTSDSRRRRHSSPSGEVIQTSGSQRLPLISGESRSHESVRRPPPAPSSSGRGRSPPRRRSSHRDSISPPSHLESPRRDRYDRHPQSPPRRRYSSSEISHPNYSSPSSVSPLRQRPREDDRHSRSGYAPIAPAVAASSGHAGAPRSDWTGSPRHSASRYPPSASQNYRPQPSRRASSPHPRPAASDRHHPPSIDSHGRRPHHSPVKPATSSPAHSAHSGSERNGLEGFFNKFPTSFATYAGIRALVEHADKAKEWAEWFNNVNDAPEEIKLLSTRVTTARDTIKQIQESLEARPDLIEDEAGQTLKSQIEDAIDSTSETLKKMTKLLSSFTGAAQQDGTALGRLEGFWHSYNYKNEGEEQVKATDAELQQQLTELSTLMSNIYARALKKPGLAPPNTATLSGTTLTQSTTGAKSQGTSETSTTGATPSTAAEAAKPTQKPAVATPDNPPLPETVGNAKKNIAASQDDSMSIHQPQSNHPANEPPESEETPEIVATPSQDPRDILLDAAWDGDLKAVARALRHAHPNSCDLQGLTALHLAAQRDNMAVAMLLLDRGADVHARADGGCMPLHLAARYASADTVEMLIERGGADPNARTTDGRTALHYAARSAEDGNEERRDVIRTLRDLGVNPTLQNRRGDTARDVAQKRDHWDAAATLRRAEKKWEEEHRPKQNQNEEQPKKGNWFQRHGFLKS